MSKHQQLRVLHVVPSYLPATVYGGPLQSIHSLCKALVARGHDVQVFTTSLNGVTDTDVPLETSVGLDGVKVTYFACRHLRRLAWAPAMDRWLQRVTPQMNVVHIHSTFQWPTYAASRISEAARVPYVFAPRGALVPELIRGKSQVIKTLWLHSVGRRIIERAARIHATSEHEYESAGRLGIPLPAPCVIPNGVDGPTNDQSVGVPAQLQALVAQPYAVFLGRISWEKGLDRLIEAVQGSHMRLLLVGQGDAAYRAQLEGLIRERGLGNALEFIGHVDGDAKWALLRAARFLVLPSYSENFGNVVVEALAVACPVIVTPEVGAKEVVRRSGGGFVATDSSASKLREAMERLWNDHDLARSMGAAGASYVTSHLTWDAVARATEDCYQSVLAASTSGATITAR